MDTCCSCSCLSSALWGMQAAIFGCSTMLHYATMQPLLDWIQQLTALETVLP